MSEKPELGEAELEPGGIAETGGYDLEEPDMPLPPPPEYPHRSQAATSQGATNAKHIFRPVDDALLREEYFRLQEIIESFDEKSLTIKAWSVTLSMGGIGAAYLQQQPILLLLSSMSALLFWVIEGLWKSFQYAFYSRMHEIERFFAGDEDMIVGPRIGHSWSQSWRSGGKRRLLRIMQWPHVWLPHGAVVLGGILLFVASLL